MPTTFRAEEQVFAEAARGDLVLERGWWRR
jgi:hypothetical protein